MTTNTTQNKKEKKSTSNNTKKREYKKREYKKTKNNKQQEHKDTSFVTLTLELLVDAMKVDRSKMVCELKQENKQQSYRQDDNYQKDQNQNSSQPKYTSELEKAYAALGIDKDASDKEIRACWRNQIRVNHPDLMESKGAEAVMKATVKCQELNKAFEIVKASRGMK